MKIFYAAQFVNMLECMPRGIQKLFLKQQDILRINWRDSRLHLKQMKGKPISFSFRMTRSYRAFFYFRTADEITLYAIGHRKDIQRKLR